MIKQPANRHSYFIRILGLCLGLALPAGAQTRSGGTSGGFGGFGGASRSSTSTGSSAGSTTRQYPNNTTIGDAYFSIDPETHRVVYIADEATAAYIRQVLTNLDRPKPQVLIKVVFVEVQHNTGLDFGIEGSFNRNLGYSSTATSLVTNWQVLPSYTTVGSNSVLSGTSIVPQSISSLTSRLPTTFLSGTNISGIAGLTGAGTGLYQIMGQDYQVTLHAIATAGNAKILSRPSIIARNNQPATITVGQEVPLITGVTYDSLGNTHNAVTYTDVGVILKVTPFITEDGLVQMMLSPQISQIDPTVSIPIATSVTGATINAPVIDIRSADTVVVTPDGQTVVIGGLIQNAKSESESKVPFVGDIPLLGNLFKRKVTTDTKSELIIFLTPHIIQAPSQLASLSATERARSAAVKALTEKELDKFLDTLPVKPPKGAAKKPAKSQALPSGSIELMSWTWPAAACSFTAFWPPFGLWSSAGRSRSICRSRTPPKPTSATAPRTSPTPSAPAFGDCASGRPARSCRTAWNRSSMNWSTAAPTNSLNRASLSRSPSSTPPASRLPPPANPLTSDIRKSCRKASAGGVKVLPW